MRISDYIVEFYVKQGITHCFCVVGGGSCFLNDSLRKYQNQLNTTFFHHEQAASFAAEAYSKLTQKPCICMVTTGCGSTNAITGLLSCFQDHVPVIFIAGQVSSAESNPGFSVGRQFGVQGANIGSMVFDISWYRRIRIPKGQTDTDRQEFNDELCAILHATIQLPPSPSWIEVPISTQKAEIDEKWLESVEKMKPSLPYFSEEFRKIPKDIFQKSKRLLKDAKNPAILIGNGVKLGNCWDSVRKFATKHDIPVFATFLAADLVPNDGVIGIKGDNKGIRESDLVLVLGSRLSTATVGYHGENVANANLIIVDIVPENHRHRPEYDWPEIVVGCDVERFVKEMELIW